MPKILLPVLLSLSLIACKNESSDTYFLECTNIQSYEGNSTLYDWDTSVVENDTAYIQVFFDTLLFDSNGTINTISFTWFKDEVPNSFDWDKYILGELESIRKNFTLKSNGLYHEDDKTHWWFYVDDGESLSYIEYISTSPLTIINYSSSKEIDLLKREFCTLKEMARQAKRLTP